MKRETLRKIVCFLLRTLTDTQFLGTEHVPPQGGILIVTNHMSRVDTPVLFANPVRPDITALVADKYQRYSFFSWFTRTAGGIWLDRDRADFAAFRQALEVLKQGRALGIAPEGTRSDQGQLLPGKPGSVLLAQRANVPIVPVAIAGSESAMADLRKLRRPKIRVRFGPAFQLPPIDRNDREGSLQLATDEIMCRIAALLPERYWGYYANHPRLKELISGG